MPPEEQRPPTAPAAAVHPSVPEDHAEPFTPEAKSAAKGAWFGLFVDYFDIYLPIVALAPALSYFMSEDLSPDRGHHLRVRPVRRVIPRAADRHLHLRPSRRRRRPESDDTDRGRGRHRHDVPRRGTARLRGGRDLGHRPARPAPSGRRRLHGRPVHQREPARDRGRTAPSTGSDRWEHRGGISDRLRRDLPGHLRPALVAQHRRAAGPYQEWGWRIPFIVGGFLSPAFFYYRKEVQESEVWKEQGKRPRPEGVSAQGSVFGREPRRTRPGLHPDERPVVRDPDAHLGRPRHS